jgi:hypothetical protein
VARGICRRGTATRAVRVAAGGVRPRIREFGPNPIDAILPSLDADGFPEDVFFYDSMAPFTHISAQGTLSGLLRVRHIPPPP